MRDALPSAALFLALGPSANPTPLAGLGVTSPVSSLFTLQTGVFALQIPGGLGLQTFFTQALQVAPSGTRLLASNALLVELLP